MEKRMPLVSVIVPVYNVSEYVERCINSIIRQNYSNIEVILVDDGSTDNSGAICDDFAQKDNRIRVIHKENGGLSDARNVALEIIEGEWVTFIDSDDWVCVDYIESLLTAAIESEADIAIAMYKSVENETNQVVRKVENCSGRLLDNEAAVKALLYQKQFTTAACCKLYRSEFWSDVRFPVGKLYEDVETIYRIFAKAKRAVFLQQVLYFYFQRQGSIVRTSFSVRKMDYVENCKLLLKRIEQDYPHLKRGAISRLLWAEFHVLIHMDDCQKYRQEYEMIWNDIKTYRKIVIFDSECRLQNRMLAILSYGGTGLIRFVYKIIH